MTARRAIKQCSRVGTPGYQFTVSAEQLTWTDSRDVFAQLPSVKRGHLASQLCALEQHLSLIRVYRLLSAFISRYQDTRSEDNGRFLYCP
ncbi:hypothetical protein J6590_060876 [Homalodisca vitripennis]|nr:hypothetical protein J6590_060876 [Homalodisca vitripennis]